MEAGRGSPTLTLNLGVEYMDNNKSQKDNSSGPGYYTEQEKHLEYKKPDYTREIDNNLVNSSTRQIIKRDCDEESVGTLIIDEDDDKDESMMGNTSIFNKVKIWKENANMRMSMKKEISHLELKRHRIEFEDPAHDVNRSGLQFELMQNLNGEDFTQGKRNKCQSLLKELVNIEDGYLYQGPEMKNLMKIMSVIKKTKLTMEPKMNYIEEKIILNGKNYQFKCFNGYLGDQLKSEAIHKMVDKPIMNVLLEAEGYDSSKEDLGERYRQCATLKVWRTILRGREENKPKVAGDLLNSFDDSQWEEEDLNINSTELGSESQRIVQQRYFPLGIDLEHMKANFPNTYELNMIMCLQNLLIEYTKNQGSWRETPSNGLVSIFQEDKPFECKEFSKDLDLENIKHTFRIPKQNNVLIDAFPDLRILLSAGYLNNRGRLRKYEKTAKEIIIGQRVIKKSKNIAVRPGWRRRRTYVDIIKHTEKGTKSELDFTIEDMKSKERSEQSCRCQETLHAQICYTEEFYDRSRLMHRRENVVEDLNPWINNEIILKNGVNPAMNSYSINSNRPLVPSEPGAIVSSTPHEKTGLFCGTTNTLFRDKIMEKHGDRDLTRIIEKERNQLPERLSNKAMIGEQIEEEIRRGYNTIACYIAGNPVVAPSMFTSFEKFGDVKESTETWKVKDMEQLLANVEEQTNERIKVQEQTNKRIGEVKNDKSQYEDKIKELERKYREEKIKNAGLTRKINAIETEKDELKQEIENVTEFFNVLDGINEELKNRNECYSAQTKKDMRYITYLDSGIAEGEELFTVIDEMNDELIAENVGLKEINRNLKTENERLESDLEDSENAWGKFANAELEEMEDNSDEFFVVIDEMNDELIAENVGLKETNRNLKTDNERLKSDLEDSEDSWGKFADGRLEDMEENSGEFFALEMKNKMMARRIKTNINKEKKERKNSTYSDEESQLYDELYEGLCTYENTIAVQPKSSYTEQETIPISNIDNSKKETVHQRQDMLLDEFLKNEFKIRPENESDSE
ncbi:uncharacterized protein LOC111697586 [Eurytemora carolleeae]|uniref:uncharacterized protein LOC111697586 n=1 Tax=Eurytemora carolleeae TaxID=1294199 RepID=UPI000C7584E9|nr:uncharacterized protein LOC111697586 [Eurytemora carolleeae]|eukprot:XP_023323406.1 uncharacterized protein LOC111697586 [Eurytemora affinis]